MAEAQPAKTRPTRWVTVRGKRIPIVPGTGRGGPQPTGQVQAAPPQPQPLPPPRVIPTPNPLAQSRTPALNISPSLRSALDTAKANADSIGAAYRAGAFEAAKKIVGSEHDFGRLWSAGLEMQKQIGMGVTINAFRTAAIGILRAGRWASYWERGGAAHQGEHYANVRLRAEKRMGAKKEDNLVYGSAGSGDTGSEMYGEVCFKMKDSVAQQSLCTPGDSLLKTTISGPLSETGLQAKVASVIQYMVQYNAADLVESQDQFEKSYTKVATTGPFAEVQMPGALATLDNVEEIVWAARGDRQEVPDELVRAATERGFKVRAARSAFSA